MDLYISSRPLSFDLYIFHRIFQQDTLREGKIIPLIKRKKTRVTPAVMERIFFKLCDIPEALILTF